MDERWLSVDNIAEYLGGSKDTCIHESRPSACWSSGRALLAVQDVGSRRADAGQRCCDSRYV